jgi:hypothetical protein
MEGNNHEEDNGYSSLNHTTATYVLNQSMADHSVCELNMVNKQEKSNLKMDYKQNKIFSKHAGNYNIRSMIYSYLDLTTLIRTIGVLSKQDRSLLQNHQIQNELKIDEELPKRCLKM